MPVPALTALVVLLALSACAATDRTLPPVTFDCQGDGDAVLTAAFFNDTDPPTALLTLGADKVRVAQVRAASGARYQGEGVELWEHQGEARVDWDGRKLTCRPRPDSAP